MRIATAGATAAALVALLALAARADPGGSPDAADAADAADAVTPPGAVRVENEYKLTVPGEQLEALWAYLTERYEPGPRSLLPELGPEFTATFGDEDFVDQYFDAPGLPLLRSQCGERHRARWNRIDTSARKHGRQRVQIKLRRGTDPATLSRTEVKFKVDPPEHPKTPLDRHPLLGLVASDDRPALIATLAEEGIDAEALTPSLTIRQRRRRIYISRRGASFATLTLDEVAAPWFLWRAEFVELEIELNEIAYTRASPLQRQAMEAVSRRLADDVLGAFPEVRQDQLPKYNKAYRALAARIPSFEALVLHEQALVAALLSSVLVLVLAALWLLPRLRARLRRARAEARATEGAPPTA